MQLRGPQLGQGRLVRGRSALRVRATVQAPAQAPYRVTDSTIQDIQSMFKSLLQEYDYKIQDQWVEGTIPPELCGTYLRNGPGMQVSNKRYKRHTFDGDGMLLSFTFKDGQAWFKNKFVRTQGFLDEQAAGRPVHRTAFTRGSADGNPFFNPFDFQLKNVANTGVLHWGGKTLALYESGLPHEVDLRSLDTLGPTQLSGQLATNVLAAHYRVMPGRQQLQQLGRDEAAAAAPAGRTWVGFSFNSGLGDSIIFYEFAESGGLAVPPQHFKLPGVAVALIHDIAVTPDYYVVVVGPVQFSPSKFLTEYLTSRCSIAECLQYDPSQPTRIHLVPRPTGAKAGAAPVVLDAPAMFTFHHVNAFQVSGSSDSSSSSAGDLLVLDTVAWDEVSFDANQHNLSPGYYRGGARSQLRRLVFRLPAAAALGSNGSSTGSSGQLLGNFRLARRCTEFPSVNWDLHGQPHSHIYCCADRVDDDLYWGPAQTVMKLTLPHPLAGTQEPLAEAHVAADVWDAGSRCIVNEPLFVPSPSARTEDDGWVLVTVHNAETALGQLVILDARCLAAGPVATIKLPHFLPAGLHGSFASGAGDFERAEGLSAEPEWREPNTVVAL